MPNTYDPEYYKKNRARIRQRASEYYHRKRAQMIASGAIQERPVGRPKKVANPLNGLSTADIAPSMTMPTLQISDIITLNAVDTA